MWVLTISVRLCKLRSAANQIVTRSWLILLRPLPGEPKFFSLASRMLQLQLPLCSQKDLDPDAIPAFYIYYVFRVIRYCFSQLLYYIAYYCIELQLERICAQIVHGTIVGAFCAISPKHNHHTLQALHSLYCSDCRNSQRLLRKLVQS